MADPVRHKWFYKIHCQTLKTSMTCCYSANISGGIKHVTTGFLLSLVSNMGAVKQST